MLRNTCGGDDANPYGRSVQDAESTFFTCFINVNQCCYRPVKALESHGVLHWSGIFKIQRFALFGPFSSFFRAFSAGKAKTSDFLRQNHGCLPSKVPMFYLKKSDVLGAETRCFQHLLPSFRPFLRRNAEKTSSRRKISLCKMIFEYCKTYKKASKFTLIPELKFVIIFEGFRAFLLKFSCGLKPAWAGVCNPHPSLEWYPSRLTFASDAVWR